jgi:steroid 5-alpha reductase family enzyme
MLLETLIFSMVFNILMFIPAFIFKTDKLTDLSYAITFIGLSIYIFLSKTFSIGNLLLFLMILAWALRLGTFLFIRIQKQKKDDRFDNIRNKFFKFLGFWLLQGFTVWIVMLSVILFDGKYNLIGLLIWFCGLLIESFADAQKSRFIKNPKNKGDFISSGLWKNSRHPNYFGEIMCWVGVYVFSGVWFFGIISPLYIFSLLSFVSGIPILEKKADKIWGKRKDYQEYKKSTSILVPWFKK